MSWLSSCSRAWSSMLGFQKYVAQQPTLCRAGIRVLAIAAALVAFGVLAFLNSAISPRSLPSTLVPSLENGSTPSPSFVAIEKPTDPGTNSSLAVFLSPPSEHKKANPIPESTRLNSLDKGSIPSLNLISMEKSSDPERNTSITATVSPPYEQKKVKSRSSDNSSLIDEITKGKNTSQTISGSEETSCEARRLPVVNKKKRSNPVSLQEMEQILSNNRRSSCSRIPRWSSEADLQILAARTEIEKAAIIDNHPQVYAPVFRNISMFKRSYELMEKILKVYVYKEGEKPIFHSPYLRGIYASEGWFMKNMEQNKRFRVENPTKAHLFYLPFSSKILRDKLYIDGSGSRKNIDQYLKNYVSRISSAYPFWNRTAGADHFLAACHDWAPSETREAMGSTIRALCNADLSGVYELGKDLTLTEANVFDAKNPELGLGGRPVRERPVLAFFAGKMHGYLRPQLLEEWGKGDPDIKVFGPLGRKARKQNATMSYAEYMRKSKFCICPRGYEVHSPRIVEAILHECVPVIISDNFVPPFFEVLKWEEFSVMVKEEDIPRLKEILLSISASKYYALQAAVKKVQKHFVWHNLPQRYDAFHMTLHSVWLNRVFQFRPR